MATHRFTDDVVAAVLHHMNNDHTGDNLVIVRAFADPDAATAVMTALDGEAGTWRYRRGDATSSEFEARIPWSGPITQRPEIRREVVALYERGCQLLESAPREERS